MVRGRGRSVDRRETGSMGGNSPVRTTGGAGDRGKIVSGRRYEHRIAGHNYYYNATYTRLMKTCLLQIRAGHGAYYRP